MEIHGSFFPPVPYPGAEQLRKDPPPPPGREGQVQPIRPMPIPPAVKTAQSDVEQQRKRFYALDNDLTHPARQALNTYQDTDFAGGPELMNRVDVYA